jgi:hypothetical protein
MLVCSARCFHNLLLVPVSRLVSSTAIEPWQGSWTAACSTLPAAVAALVEVPRGIVWFPAVPAVHRPCMWCTTADNTGLIPVAHAV